MPRLRCIRLPLLATLISLSLLGCGSGSPLQSAGTSSPATSSNPSNSTASVSSSSSSTSSSGSYLLGITLDVSGLSATETVGFLLNGQDPLTATHDGTWTFTDANGGPTGLPPNTAYQVTVSPQPSSEICTVVNGSGTTGTSPPAAIQVTCSAAPAASVKSQITRTEGPAPREGAASWTDMVANHCLFGGEAVSTGAAESFGDFWCYRTATLQWQRIDSASLPGARAYAALWVDLEGNVWIFGGVDQTARGPSYLNDLWELKSGSVNWIPVTTIGPSPEARAGAAAWVGTNGRLWLSGGRDGPASDLSDLWYFDPYAQRWSRP